MNNDLIKLFKANGELGKQLIDSLPIAFYVTDAEGRLTYYNSPAAEFSGRSPELGSDQWSINWKLYYPDGTSMPHEESPLAVSLKEGRSLNGVEGIAERPDGNRRWFKAYPSPLRNDNGDITGGINMLIDISDQKQTEVELRGTVDELEQQKRLYEAISSSIPDLIYIFDLNYRFIFANDALLEMWGRPREEAIGKGMRELGYEPWHAEMHEREIDQVVTTKEPVQGEVSFPHDKLGERFYDYIFVPILDDEGKVEAVAGITRDVTDRRQAQQALRKNRDRLRAAFEIETVGVLFWGGDDLTITEVNDAFLNMSGYTREEALGKSWQELTPEEHHPISEQAVENVKSSGKTEPYEKQNIRKDGSRFWGLFAPRRIDDNEVVEFVIDITDRKEAEQEREQLLQQVETEKERLSNIFRQAPSFMCILRGPDHVFERANELYRKLIGEDREIIGKTAREVFPEIEGQGFFEMLDQVYETGEPCIRTDIPVKINRDPDSEGLETRYLDLVYQPLRNADGSVDGIFAQGVDLTERHHAKEKLKAMNETLEERVEKRTKELRAYQQQLRSLASQLNKAEEQERQRLASELHDKLGQMLTVAKMQVAGLRYNNIPDQISDELEELNQVVDDALKYNQNLMSELKPPPVLDKEDVTEVLLWTAKNMGKELDISIEDDGKSKPVDKELRSVLHQSVRELLRNIVKHADTNKARLHISSNNNQVKVVVEDNGQGFNMNKNRPAPTEGGRFGLFNIQERMDWHGGAFEIHSEPGKGTKAVLYAPLKEIEQLEKKDQDNKETHPPSDKIVGQDNLEQKIKVLLVDDHDMVRRGLRQMIEKQDDLTIVEEASNGQEAVDLAYKTIPDIIVMDVNMPIMDGIEATQKIKAEMSNVRIIGLSLHDSPEVIEDMRSAGASSYLTKNEAFETLCKTIRSQAAEL